VRRFADATPDRQTAGVSLSSVHGFSSGKRARPSDQPHGSIRSTFSYVDDFAFWGIFGWLPRPR
jgi:hypothetical protein